MVIICFYDLSSPGGRLPSVMSDRRAKQQQTINFKSQTFLAPRIVESAVCNE
jgi:hypothetical protein